MRAVDGDGKELDLSASCVYQKSVRDGATIIDTTVFGGCLRKIQDFFPLFLEYAVLSIHMI